MHIAGSVDTTTLDRGFDRVKSGLEGVKGHVQGMSADFRRMEAAAGAVAKRLLLIGGVGVGAMMALASKAPAVAPAMAKMKVTMDRLSRSLGRALSPAFEMAANTLSGFTDWITANEGTISKLATTLVSVATAVGKITLEVGELVLDNLEKLMGWIGKNNIDFIVDFPGLDKMLLGGILMAYGAAGNPVALAVGTTFAVAGGVEVGTAAGEAAGPAIAGAGREYGNVLQERGARFEEKWGVGRGIMNAWNVITGGAGTYMGEVDRKKQLMGMADTD